MLRIFFLCKIDMKLLDGGEADIDVVFVDTFKIGDRRHGNTNRSEVDGFIEEVFERQGIEEIVLCLFDDIGGVDEEEEISIAFFVEVENQARHDERFTAAGRHIEQKMQGLFLAVGKSSSKQMQEPCKGFFLIRTEFKGLGLRLSLR